MRSRVAGIRSGVLFVTIVPAIAAGGMRVPAMSLDELVARHVEARGGLEALRAVQTVQLTGRLIIADGAFEYSFKEVLKRPDQVREEFSAQGLTGIQVWDGTGGWQIMPFAGRKDPERTARDDNKGLMDDADFDGPLVNAAAKGATLEYLGTEDVDGTEAHKVKVTQKDGDTLTVFLDPDHFLIIRILYQHTVRGAVTPFETDFGNYERIGGVLIPFLYESGNQGVPRTQRIVIDKAEVNVPADGSLFAFPTGAHKE
jgi:hypothetical protein